MSTPRSPGRIRPTSFPSSSAPRSRRSWPWAATASCSRRRATAPRSRCKSPTATRTTAKAPSASPNNWWTNSNTESLYLDSHQGSKRCPFSCPAARLGIKKAALKRRLSFITMLQRSSAGISLVRSGFRSGSGNFRSGFRSSGSNFRSGSSGRGGSVHGSGSLVLLAASGQGSSSDQGSQQERLVHEYPRIEKSRTKNTGHSGSSLFVRASSSRGPEMFKGRSFAPRTVF